MATRPDLLLLQHTVQTRPIPFTCLPCVYHRHAGSLPALNRQVVEYAIFLVPCTATARWQGIPKFDRKELFLSGQSIKITGISQK